MQDTRLYRVKFTRSDGTQAWLGESGCGSTDDESSSPAVSRETAELLAAERNSFYGRMGWKYEVVPVSE